MEQPLTWKSIISRSPDAVDLVEQSLRAAIILTKTDFAALAFPHADGRELAYRWATPLPDLDPAAQAALQAPFASATSLAGTVLRTGHEACLPDCQFANHAGDPLMRIGARSALAYPIEVQGCIHAILCVASLEKTGKFTPGRVQLLATIARQIGILIDRERLINEARAADRRLVENEKRASADRLHTALVQTIEAISRTVETRDPYTAGHQRRVAVLGREIALAMGLEMAIVDDLYMGGTIHDIGKLYIPAEILNRPGKLNEAEFMLIKTHCAVGRDIIAGIDFPWPLAKMVHQHHERIDGTGYPQGLRGAQILLQARILCIADVVDAMSSRRPYREALGLDAALEEIECGAGTGYDPQAAAVCIRLFTQQGLRLEDLESVN